MHEAIELSAKGIILNHCEPLRYVIVKGDETIGMENNKVASSTDPTAYAEVVAKRDAAATCKPFIRLLQIFKQ